MLPLGSRSRGIEAVYIHADSCSVRNRNCLHADLWSLNTSLIWAQLQFLINQVCMYTASIITQNHKTGCTQGRRNPARRATVSLGSRPSPYVRVLIARGWANRSSGIGKAWDDSSRESRTVVGQYLARAPLCRRGTLFS